jgi:hypothetical protein
LAKKLNQSIRRSREHAGGISGMMKGNTLSIRVAVFLIMSAGFMLFLSITDKRQPVKPILQLDTTGKSEGFVSDSVEQVDTTLVR